MVALHPADAADTEERAWIITMAKKIWVIKHHSFSSKNKFDAANRFDDAYYLRMTRRERIETMQFLREMYLKIDKGAIRAGRERLRRLFKIIKQI